MNLHTLLANPPWAWPENAGSILMDILQNPGAEISDRILAAELSSDLVVMRDNLARTLLGILKNQGENEELRKEAATAFGPVLEYCYTMEFDDPEDDSISEPVFNEIQRTLHDLFKDPGISKDLQRRVLEAAVRAPLQWQRQAVQAAFTSNDRQWRITAVFAMRFHRGFEKEILEALQDRDQDIHYQAVCAAGAEELDQAWPHIQKLVCDEDIDKPLLLAAIDAAASIRPDQAGEVLEDLAVSLDQEIADAALEAIKFSEEVQEVEDWYEGWDDSELGWDEDDDNDIF